VHGLPLPSQELVQAVVTPLALLLTLLNITSSGPRPSFFQFQGQRFMTRMPFLTSLIRANHRVFTMAWGTPWCRAEHA
jgi:hypothetical protein